MIAQPSRAAQILDFAARLLFFATMPFVATSVSAAFPMTGVLVNVVLALLVFAFAEAVQSRAARSRVIAFLVRRHLAFEAFYREHPTSHFLYYVFSPFFFPYWLFTKKGRQEVLLYRNLTGGGLAVLLVTALVDFFRHWRPELHFGQFLAVWLVLFVVQTICTLVFVVPIATTVVKLHLERRLVALWVLLGVAVVSAGFGVYRMEHRKSPVVSWVTTERLMLRTKADPKAAHAAQLEAVRAVWAHPEELAASTDKQGWVEEDALDRADQVLEDYYKADEAYAFTLHAIPPEDPNILLLQCHLGWGRPSLWLAVRKSGQEITSKDDLPPGVLGVARKTTRRAPTKPRPTRKPKK
jgi:hypothetical protein